MRSYERRFMTPRQQIQLGQILGTALYAGWFALRRRSAKKHTIETLAQELESSYNRGLYLASLLDKHGIEVDEFDLIALKNL
jgi:hypothetical protein